MTDRDESKDQTERERLIYMYSCTYPFPPGGYITWLSKAKHQKMIYNVTQHKVTY